MGKDTPGKDTSEQQMGTVGQQRKMEVVLWRFLASEPASVFPSCPRGGGFFLSHNANNSQTELCKEH
jgi:hypothetical protein